METSWSKISASLTAADPARAARAAQIPPAAIRAVRIASGPLRAAALVRGSAPSPYRVTIAASGRGSCTCPAKGVCKHSAALAAHLAVLEAQAAAEAAELAEAEEAVRAAEGALEAARMTRDGLLAARRERLLAGL